MISMARSFGAPVIDPPGKVAREERADVDVRHAASPATRRDEVVHRRMALEPRRAVDAHAAGDADAAEVVALEVDDHHVLGALLGIARQLGGERRVARRVVAARARALDGPGLDPAPAPAEQQLGRVPDDGRVAQVEVARERRRVPPREPLEERPGGPASGAVKGCVRFTW